ncbi:anti-sigma factor [Albibacterium bauzanense]|uniref:Anti-sigma-K factor rskA n=1 Tax=Albibacterium bauzanense TaxID=653929 RepID=A0A4R1M0Q2_9SPHI|nr:anti-sigma factor [Albibacterium bauzanense]TCK85195.1 anti-sigma-K factor rskA [Albibacterium bauzanense]
MNIPDYISSGNIEAYVLGLLGEEEALELERLCLEYPEIKAAVQETESALENYAQLNAITPPKHSKKQIWATINNSTIDKTAINSESETIRFQKTSQLYTYLAVAAALLIFIGLPYHFIKMNQYKAEISTLKKEKIEILAQNKTFQAQIQNASKELDVLSNPATRNVFLAGVAGYENNEATLYWSNSGEVFLKANLPQLSIDKQYQLWAIVSGKPVSAGLLDQQANTLLQKMVTIEKAEMFAITIEKQGGSIQPTLEQMVVAGKPL